MSDWIVPNFKKLTQESLFDDEYDYFVSLGHRCCVGQSLNYMRKSSFPFDWQITPIDTLCKIFKNEFKGFYPDSGVDFVHVIYEQDENGNDINKINESVTNATFNRRCSRLVKLLKENKRKLLFVRHKYIWYWSKWPDSKQQIDSNSINYDLTQLIELSHILKTQYNNDKFRIMYIYQDVSEFSEFNWDENGAIPQSDFVLPGGVEQIELAKQFKYVEQTGFERYNITPIVVNPGPVKVEGNAMISCINNFVKLSDTQDFNLPYGFEEYKLTRNIDNE